MNRPYLSLYITTILFMVILIPRYAGLDTSVAPDEPRWLTRSANFYHAISSRTLNHTYQTEHPGVTIMALGALGLYPYYPTHTEVIPDQFTWDRGEFETWLEENSEYTPLAILVAGRRWIVFIITLILTLCYFPLRHLLGTWRGLIAILFVAWSPFGIALSRQLHPDGLLSALLCLSLSAFLAWLYGERYRRFLILSAIAMGLALLTKMPAVLLVLPVILLICIMWLWQDRRSPTLYLSGGALWMILALLTILIAWPVLWIQPIATIQIIADALFGHAATDLSDNYFLGRITKNPGVLFYPMAYLWRITPITFIGIAFAIFALWKRTTFFRIDKIRRMVIAIFLFAIVYGIGMGLGAKKSDRYLLPAILLLEIVAALGWMASVEILASYFKSFSAFSKPKWVLSAIMLLHIWPSLAHYPYYFLYHNPMLGGDSRASNLFVIGWGEGLDQAARWLNQQPDAETLRVVSWYPDGSFSYFFNGETGNWNRLAPLDWMDTDYAVLYINQRQRHLPTAEVISYFDQYEPVHVIHEQGLELARIYDLRDTLIPDNIAVDDSRAVDFNHDIRLIAHELMPKNIEEGGLLTLKLHLQNLRPMETNYNLLVQLLDQNYQEHWRTEGWPWGAPTSEWRARQLRTDVSEFNLPIPHSPGFYRIGVTFYDPTTLDNLSVTDARSNELLGEHFLLDYVEVKQANENYQESPPIAYLGDTLILQDIRLDTTLLVEPGQTQNIYLQWRTVKRPMADYTVFIHLIDSDNRLIAQYDTPPMQNFIPTHLWQNGMVVNDVYPLTLPLDMLQGQYHISIGLYDPKTGERLPVVQDDKSIQDAVMGPFLKLDK